MKHDKLVSLVHNLDWFKQESFPKEHQTSLLECDTLECVMTSEAGTL